MTDLVEKEVFVGSNSKNGRKLKYTDEELIQSARKYLTKTEWVRNEPTKCYAARRRAIYKECVKHMLPPVIARLNLPLEKLLFCEWWNLPEYKLYMLNRKPKRTKKTRLVSKLPIGQGNALFNKKEEK